MTTARVASPCSGVCRIDEASRLCAGCARTLDEIAAWSALDDDARRSVWARLPARRAQWPRLFADAPVPPTEPSP